MSRRLLYAVRLSRPLMDGESVHGPIIKFSSPNAWHPKRGIVTLEAKGFERDLYPTLDEVLSLIAGLTALARDLQSPSGWEEPAAPAGMPPGGPDRAGFPTSARGESASHPAEDSQTQSPANRSRAEIRSSGTAPDDLLGQLLKACLRYGTVAEPSAIGRSQERPGSNQSSTPPGSGVDEILRAWANRVERSSWGGAR